MGSFRSLRFVINEEVMDFVKHKVKGVDIVELVNEGIVVNTIDDGSDVLANAYYQGFDKLVVYQHQLRDDFFDLKNRFAGEVLQKFSNFRVRLVIVGQFETVVSKSLSHFILESNKGKQVNFVASLSEALVLLSE